jgi:hypothetical protein
MTDPLQMGRDIFEIEFDQPLGGVHDIRGQAAAVKNDFIAGPDLFKRPEQRFISITVRQSAQQKNLNLPAAAVLAPQQPGRNNTAVIENNNTARRKIIDDAVKMFVTDFPGFSINDHEPGLIAFAQGFLGYQMFREIIIKFVAVHRR